MTRRAPAFLLAAVLAALAPGARAADDVIYPRTATSAAPAESTRAGGNLNLLTGLLAVACAAAGGWLYLRNRRLGPGGLARAERKLTIAESRALGNRQHLVVADYAGRKYLLGVCPGRIELLTPLSDGQPPTAP